MKTQYLLNDKVILETDEMNPHLGASFLWKKERFQVIEINSKKDPIQCKVVKIVNFPEDNL